MFLRSKGEPERFRRYPYGPGGSRLYMAVLVLVVGVVVSIVGATGLGGASTVLLLVGGPSLIVVGTAGLFLARWMAKRRM